MLPKLLNAGFIKICQNTPQLCWGDEWPSLYPGDCVVIREMVKNVMLNLFQHLIKSMAYETLK